MKVGHPESAERRVWGSGWLLQEGKRYSTTDLGRRVYPQARVEPELSRGG